MRAAYSDKYGEEVVVGSTKKVKFGHKETILKHDVEGSEFEKLIELTDMDYYFDYEQQHDHIQKMTQMVKGESNFTQPDDPSLNITCANANSRGTDDPDAQWMWAPIYAGDVSPTKKIQTFAGNCFQEITMEMEKAKRKDRVKVTIHAAKARNLFCSDVFFFGNTEKYWVEDIFFRGKHSFTLKLRTED